MPIGVPRIIYCWGEELPAQWTDIYNFIFRRRMVFLMQYLDDELCNQICGLLINIHMEDRSKELEKKEIERSGVFKSSSKPVGGTPTAALSSQEKGMDARWPGPAIEARSSNKQNASFYNKKSRSMEDLLNADEDLGIDDIDTLEQFTLQKITTEWLNWNAQFFDYSDEPYLFYLAELLSKDFNKAQNSQRLNEQNPLYLLSRTYYNQKSPLSSEGRQGETEVSSTTSSYSGRKEKQMLHSQLLSMLKNKKEASSEASRAKLSEPPSSSITGSPEGIGDQGSEGSGRRENSTSFNKFSNSLTYLTNKAKVQMGEVYSPFRTNANFSNTLGFKITTNVAFAFGFLPLSQRERGTPGSEAAGCFAAGDIGPKETVFKENMISGETSLNDSETKLSLKTKKQKLLQMFQQYKSLGWSYMAGPSPIGPSFSNSLFSTLTPLRDKATELVKEQGIEQSKKIQNLLTILAQKNFSSKLSHRSPQWPGDQGPDTLGKEGEQGNNSVSLATQNFTESSQKILGQRNLRREYNLERNFSSNGLISVPFAFAKAKANSIENKSQGKIQNYTHLNKGNQKSFNYLSPFATSLGSSEGSYMAGPGPIGRGLLKPGSLSSSGSGAVNSQSEFRDYYRKQTERTLIEEESKKVFVIINSFGGSVGNGVTVHDALQFIKAGSLTLALGVAASAASLALAGGTIGERYVTEGCHVMIHQPESSLQGQASDIWIDSQEIMKIRLDVAEIYSLSTYRPRHKILRDLDRDFYLTATETIQYGLADEIATNEVMMTIMEEVNRAWDYHDSKQQRLLETRESASSGLDTQTQN